MFFFCIDIVKVTAVRPFHGGRAFFLKFQTPPFLSTVGSMQSKYDTLSFPKRFYRYNANLVKFRPWLDLTFSRDTQDTLPWSHKWPPVTLVTWRDPPVSPGSATHGSGDPSPPLRATRETNLLPPTHLLLTPETPICDFATPTRVPCDQSHVTPAPLTYNYRSLSWLSRPLR